YRGVVSNLCYMDVVQPRVCGGLANRSWFRALGPGRESLLHAGAPESATGRRMVGGRAGQSDGVALNGTHLPLLFLAGASDRIQERRQCHDRRESASDLD